MPVEIPNRVKPEDYHYYAYLYPNDTQAQNLWELSSAQAQRGNYQFYSMRNNLAGLLSAGKAKNVPYIQLNRLGFPCVAPDNPLDFYYVEALSFGGTRPTDPIVLFTGGIHAREWIAPAMTYLLAEYLIVNYNENPEDPYQTAIRDLVNSRRICIAPMLNPVGNWYTVFSPNNAARMWRKNRRRFPTIPAQWENLLYQRPGKPNPPFKEVQITDTNITYKMPIYKSDPLNYDTITITPTPEIIGVDCNRNFNTTYWGYEADVQDEGKPSGDTYFGPAGSSERETRALSAFVNGLLVGIAASIDYHSYGKDIIFPTEATLSDQYKKRGQALQTLIATKLNPSPEESYEYRLGTCLSLLNYYALSAVDDYMSTEKNSHAFTIELDPKEDNPGFNLPQEKIMSVFEKNIRGALGLIAGAAINLDVTAGSWNTQHFINTAFVRRFANWNVFGRGNQLPV